MRQKRPSRRSATIPLVGLLCATCLTGRPVALQGQTDAAPRGELAEAYVDRSFAFSVAYPAGASIVREKRSTGPNETELARFVQLEEFWSLAVRLWQTARPLTTRDLIEGLRDNLRTLDPDMQELRADTDRAADREIVRFEALTTSDDAQWFHQQAVIPHRGQQYYTLIMLSPTADERTARNAFDNIVASFRFLRPENAQQQIDSALQRGTNLLLSIAGRPLGLGLDEPVHAYYRVVRDGTETGFVNVQQSGTTLAGRRGVGVQEIGWHFDPDGSVTHTARAMFVANTMDFSQWDNRIRILPSASTAQERRVLVGAETGMRQGDKLLVAYSPTFNAQQMEEKVIQIDPNFAGSAFFAILPRLIDLDRPELYAFAAYDSDRRGLSLQTLEVVEGAQVVIEGQVRAAVRLRGSEGLLPPYDETFVDREGRPLKITTGRVEMTATTEEYVERRYRARVEESLALFEKHPAPWPEPPSP
jgi:hypothetical protein